MQRLRIIALVALTLAAPALAGPAVPGQMTLSSGQTLSVATLRGRVVIINYWANWCVPCRQEIPVLARYYRAHQMDGLVVIGISVDPGKNGQGQATGAGIPYPQAIWVGGPDIKVAALPTSVIIGRDGRVRYNSAAPFTTKSLNAVVAPLLAER